MNKRIGLIAGSGSFPIIFSKKAADRGFSIYAIGYHNETEPLLSDYVESLEVIHIGQIKRLIKFFKKNRIKEAVMIGAIKKPGAILDIRPDMKAISLIANMRHSTHDDKILRAFAKVLEDEGFRIRSSTFLLPELLAEEGCWTKRKPTNAELSDIELGWKMAKEIGRLDIGQCVVVCNGTVMAVEAIDGTDSTIRRGGGFCKGNSVVVKVCKPIQDFRFDVPAVGAQTIRSMHESGATVLVVEAGRSLVFDKEEMIRLANQWGIIIMAMEKEA
ncbi:MAG: LpxI family protein [Desulfobacteraceae bacterium]|nr:UDP-2,3-diacylglucosamine diphosphatase LpxI [Desulfobacteraceae bacterium]MBC2755309.1 LpxI family protein [Desulfobacteraceae bacterium]